MATILVVDDRPSNRAYLAMLLRPGGHRLLEAGNGANALEQVRDERPDLVITDILMPTMDGYEFVQHVRADPGIASTPVIFYTATYSAPQARALAAFCGVSTVLAKPCGHQEILAAVNLELGTHESPAGAPPAAIRSHPVSAGGIGESPPALPEHPAMTRRVASRLAELLAAGMKVIAGRDPARLVELYFSAACELVESSHAAVGMLDQDEKTLRHVQAKGMDAAIFRGEAGMHGMLGSLLSGKRVLRTGHQGGPGSMDGLPAGHPPISSLIGIAVSSAERVYGWLYFADNRGRNGFSEDDVFVANAVARQLALLYENATLYDLMQRHAGKLHIEAAGRKHAEERLRESEQRLRTIFEAEPECVKVVSKDMVLLDMNPAGLAMLEAGSLAEAQARPLIEFIVPANRAAFAELHARVMRGESGILEFEVIGLKGARRWLESHAAPLGGRNGDAPILLSITRDVTVRKKAAQELRESEARFRSLTKLSSDWFWEQDEDHRFSQLSGGDNVEGWRPDQVKPLGLHRWDLGGVIPISCSWEEHKELLDAHKPFRNFEYQRILGDGRLQCIEASGEPIFDAGGRFTGYRGVATDITARNQAARALGESERRFSDLLRNVQLLSVMLDRESRITYCNEYLLQLTGWRLEEVIGRNWVELFIPPESGDLKDRLAALLAGAPEARHGENSIVTRSGERRLIRWNNSVLRSGAGEVTGTASIGEDITEQRLAETRIICLNRVHAVLSAINTLIIHAHSRRDLFREACSIACSTGGFPLAWIGEVDREAMRVKPAAGQNTNESFFARIRMTLREDAPEGLGVVGRAVRDRSAVVSNDVQNDPSITAPGIVEGDARSLAVLPLIVSDEAVGVLVLHSETIGFFDREEMKLLQELAGNISFAIDSIDRTEKLARTTRVNAMLSGINGAIVRIRGRQELFEEACRIAVDTGALHFAWLGVVDASGAQLQLVASAGRDDGFLQMIRDRLAVRDDAPETQALGTRAIREGRAVVVNDVAADAILSRRKAFADRGIKSVAVLPLFIAGRVAGAFALHAEQAGFFDDQEMMLLNEVAANIAFALEHMEKEEKVLRLTRVYAVLSGINSAIVRIPERDELFREVCRIAVADGGFFLARVVEVASDGKARIAASTEADARLFQEIVDEYNRDPANSGSMLALALRSEQPLISNDVAHDPRIPNRAALTEDGNYALALLPIIVERRITGTIVLRSRESGLFDDEELHLLRELTSNLSFALEHIGKETKVRRLTRVHAVLSGINSLIVRVTGRDELFKEACRIAVEHGGFAMSWIGALDPVTQDVTPVAWAGEAAEELTRAKSSALADTPCGTGAVGQSIRARRPIFNNNILTQSFGGPRLQEIIRLGFQSQITLPLFQDEAVVATLTMYTREQNFFDEEELRLLTGLADDISFAISHMAKQERLDYLAFYDELTGLANRRVFLERVAQYMRSAVSGGHKLALFFVDLERFRKINDSLGRPAGDALLKQVAAWLARDVGDSSLLARIGADHFAVVLPKVKQDGNVAALVDRSIHTFLDHSFQLNDTDFRISCRVGVALFPADGTDAETLLRNAEAALNKAKERGDRYLFYKPKMTTSVAGTLTLENQLRRALEKDEFVLHFQPKVNLESGKPTGAEALIRWNDPRTGLVAPGRFIPILEETGLILDVGRWALRKAIEDYLRWRTAGLPAVRIAVNVSPLQLRNPGFVAEIAQAIGVHADAAAGLELEITETLIMEDVKHNIASLQAIRAMGVPIAIDDFGTGFSSLSYLARLPVDTLKIDRSFVIDMTTGPPGLALVPTIINLAHSLKLKVVAEGVETEEQSRLLRLLRCDEMQGFLFSQPVPAEIFEAQFLAPAPVGAAA